MIRIKAEEVARLQALADIRSVSKLARLAGLSRQQVAAILYGPNAKGVKLGTLNKICAALSTPENPITIDQILEYIPDKD